jgi:GNAT superfamily N-acetyltransferase
MVERMVEVAPVADESDEQLSLDAYLETWPHENFGLPEVQAFKASLLEHADLLARESGTVLGSGFAARFPGFPDRVHVLLTVPPSHRGRGAGTALYSAISDWARERELETLIAVVADNDPESLAFAEQRGFVEERREKGVALDLTAIEPPLVQPPPGVEIVTWASRPELARGMFEVSVEASPDVPGYEDEEHEPFEAWLEHDMQGPGDRPGATFVAVAGDEVVGYAKFSLSSTTTTSAYHDLTAVKRAWRGRGVARGLKAAQIGWAKANGYEQLRTQNDERNEPIRRLNAEFGYAPAVGRIFMRGPLA